MPAKPIAIRSTGLVTSVGLSAPSSCAAMRAKISNPTETRFMNSGGEWIMAHQVPLEHPWRGRAKLAKMAAMAIAECMDAIPKAGWARIPLLLCVAEHERPGRLEGLDDQLFIDIERELDIDFAPDSAIIPRGRVSIAVALLHARHLIHGNDTPLVLIAATDSLLSWPTLSTYDRHDRLLAEDNSNGFMPGEAGGAVLVAADGRLRCTGIGFGMEAAHIDSGEPLRAEGLTSAVKAALADAGCEMHELDFRNTDISGEQYYFKEASLALSRTLRQPKAEFDLWHPAEAIGESGAAVGLAVLIDSHAACQKGYAPGPGILTHFANDTGERASAVLRYGAV